MGVAPSYKHNNNKDQVATTAPRKFLTIEDIGDLKPCHNSMRKFGGRLCHLTLIILYMNIYTYEHVCPLIAGVLYKFSVYPFIMSRKPVYSIMYSIILLCTHINGSTGHGCVNYQPHPHV